MMFEITRTDFEINVLLRTNFLYSEAFCAAV